MLDPKIKNFFKNKNCLITGGTGSEKEKNNNRSQFLKNIDENIPAGRMGKPEEIAYLVAFLCSEMSGFINGSQICVDGGETKSF